VQRPPIVRCDDRDGLQPKRASRAERAQRDLAAVCYEELRDAFFPGFIRPAGSWRYCALSPTTVIA
jgi:hypothetical protein